MAIPATVGELVYVDDGRPVLDEFGERIYRKDEWATWMLNWPSNTLNIVAGVICVFLIARYIRRGPSKMRQHVIQ